MSKTVLNVDELKLKEALSIVDNLDKASEEDIAAAILIIDKRTRQFTEFHNMLANRLKDINEAKQTSLDLVYSNDSGDEVNVMCDEIETVSINMKQLRKNAEADVSVVYSDPVYEKIFKPSVSTTRKKVLDLAAAGELPDADKIIRKTKVSQTKLFDFTSKDKVVKGE